LGTGRAQRACRHLWLRASLVGLLALIDGAERSAAWPTAASAGIAPRLANASWYGAHFAHASETQPTAEEDADVQRIRAQPLCVASSAWFGKLGDTVLFVHQRRGDELRVGYFVYFDVERPWGQNLLTYSVLPAMLIDATYSHFAFFFPGVQRLLYGPGDVEGASIAYRVSGTGELVVRDGLADDDTHHRVTLSRSDLVGSEGRVLLMTDVWSHQLGAHGAASYARREDAMLRCFSGPALQPLTRRVAQSFRLGSFEHPLRARPAFYRDEPARPSAVQVALGAPAAKVGALAHASVPPDHSDEAEP
jgi:hypothetical protein